MLAPTHSIDPKCYFLKRCGGDGLFESSTGQHKSKAPCRDTAVGVWTCRDSPAPSQTAHRADLRPAAAGTGCSNPLQVSIKAKPRRGTACYIGTCRDSPAPSQTAHRADLRPAAAGTGCSNPLQVNIKAKPPAGTRQGALFLWTWRDSNP